MAVLEYKLNQKSWQIETDRITAWVTEQGGMLAPVVFRLQDGGTAEPYYVAPWHSEQLEPDPPVLRSLRGDFFCLPFGADNRIGDENHEPHGESAYAPWTLVELSGGAGNEPATLTLSMDYRACSGSVTKRLYFGADAPVISSEHVVSGFDGEYPLGHHATLHGGAHEGEWKLYVKPFDLGRTDPSAVAPFAGGEYSALAPGADFSTLERIPTRWRDPETTDGSVFPTRRGFVDIYAVHRKSGDGHGGRGGLRREGLPGREAAGETDTSPGTGQTSDPGAQPDAQDARPGRQDAHKDTQDSHPGTPGAHLAWSAAYNRSGGYLWFQLKDESVLPATVFWVEHGGRHQSPWNGRNSCIGVEETCTYFASGRRESAGENPLRKLGIPTALRLSPDRPTTVRTVQGVLPMREEPTRIDFSLDDRGRMVCRTDKGEVPMPRVDAGWLLGGG